MLVCLVGIAAGCGSGTSGPVVLSGRTMGTTYTIKLVGPLPEGQSADALQAAVDALLERINRQMSTYLPDSEISRFNASPEGEWFEVSAALATVTAEALEVSRQTGGALDITVGPLVRLWHFGPDAAEEPAALEDSQANAAGQEAQSAPALSAAPSTTPAAPASMDADVPSDDAIAAALARVGYEQIEVRLDPPALRRSALGVEIDLSSTAKGYAVDAVAELLLQRGASRWMIEIGGEVRARGTRPDGKPWQIGVERAVVGSRQSASVIGLESGAVATSGDYRNFFEVDGRRYSHIIDPQTGSPVTHDLASVTIWEATCMRADALATALLVLGPEKGYDWAEARQMAALFVVRSGESLIEKETLAWVERFGSQQEN